ncbi:unnamed protein product [Coffea canephora]|uniref:Uncharacterized protein n=1 Tax=Coffea canephora TaxID=49390 RepID=A0A068UDM8_COFCA|nr:unnamed protein product [Coffea canephora]
MCVLCVCVAPYVLGYLSSRPRTNLVVKTERSMKEGITWATFKAKIHQCFLTWSVSKDKLNKKKISKKKKMVMLVVMGVISFHAKKNGNGGSDGINWDLGYLALKL